MARYWAGTKMQQYIIFFFSSLDQLCENSQRLMIGTVKIQCINEICSFFRPVSSYNLTDAVILCGERDPDPLCIMESNKDVMRTDSIARALLHINSEISL